MTLPDSGWWVKENGKPFQTPQHVENVVQTAG